MAMREPDPQGPPDPGGTRVVLYPGRPGEIRVRWRLDPDDPRRVVHDAAPCLRLRRLSATPGLPPLIERRLSARAARAGGEFGWRVATGPEPYQAELGLTDPRGGWLLLARSNGLVHAASLHFPDAPPLADRAPAPDMPAPDTPGPDTLAPDTPVPRAPDIAPAGLPARVYGQPAPEASRCVIEAELLIHGQAAPGTEIDLFGHPYRVGPGGRFQFRLRVDDPDLLRRALALHPPDALRQRRD